MRIATRYVLALAVSAFFLPSFFSPVIVHAATDDTEVKFTFADTSDWGSKVGAWKVAKG